MNAIERGHFLNCPAMRDSETHCMCDEIAAEIDETFAPKQEIESVDGAHDPFYVVDFVHSLWEKR